MQLVANTGWLRTLGGVDAYLAIHARQRGMPRALVDDVVDRGDLRVVPAVRGCIYLAPKADADLCLAVADLQSRARAEREQAKAGIKKGEIDAVAQAAFATLKELGKLSTDALRRALPQGLLRSLGDAGKKVGISSPLPPALRRLEFERKIERRLEGGRLDSERYVWRPIDKPQQSAAPKEPEAVASMLFKRFLQHAGAATVAMFASWSGFSQRDARSAIARTKPTMATGPDGEELFVRDDVEHLLRMGPALSSAVAFLPFEDNLVHLYSGPAHLVDDEFLDLEAPRWGTSKSKPLPPTTLRQMPHLALRPLIVDGRLGGFWEYDPDAEVALPRCFHAPSRASQILLEEQSELVSALLRSEIGHGRSFSLDTDDELRHRLKLLHTVSGQKVIDPIARDDGSKPRRMPGVGGKAGGPQRLKPPRKPTTAKAPAQAKAKSKKSKSAKKPRAT